MPLQGSIDILSHERIVGWAWDTDRPETPVGLVIAADGRVVARCLADRYRADLFAAGFGNGRISYDLVLPRPLSALSDHEIIVRREGDGEHLPGSPCMLAASTALDAAARGTIETFVATMATTGAPDMHDALAFFAAQTERLRDALSARRSGALEKQLRRGLGWQDPGLSGAGAGSGPATIVPRALVIDDSMPSESRDAASVAIVSHMRALRRLGYDVTFVPADLVGDAAALDDEGIATCLHPFYASVEDVLRRQPNAFKLVYLHRMTNAARYVGLARQHQPMARLVYSVADLHFLRSARQAQVEARPELLGLSRYQKISELAAAHQCDAVITHSTYEAGLLRTHLPAGKVHVVPWALPAKPTATAFAARRGVAFIAHYGHRPNADAARILLEQVMPAVWAQDASLPCILAGSGLPNWLRDLAKPPAETIGAVPDLATVFDRVRLTVAPLAFGAGIKGKVLASLAAGIPCACTSIAAEGLDLPAPLTELVADKPGALAAIILRLQEDEAFNARCAAAGLDYVAARLSDTAIDDGLRKAAGM